MIWHSNTIADVLQELRVDPTVGLTEQEAANRLKEYGKNSLQEQHALSFRDALVKQLRAPFTALLLTVSCLTLMLDLYKQILQQIPTYWQQSLFVMAIAVSSAFLGAFGHRYAQSSMEKIHTLSSPDAKVRRDGKEQLYAAHILVPGDIVLLSTGDIVPADCRLIAADRLRCDECDLTNATMPTDKCADTVFDNITPLAQRTNMLYAGTAITAGTATAVVVATGIRSEMAHNAARTRRSTAPLPSQKKANRLRLWWSLIIAVLSVAALIVGLFQHADRSAVILTAAAMAMAALPYNAADVLAQLTAHSIRRMTHHQMRLYHPEVAETVGRVTVFCAEQETLFEGSNARLCRAFVGHHTVDLAANTPQTPGLGQLMRLAALNASGTDPIDRAVLAYVTDMGIHRSDLLTDMPRIGDLSPTDSHKTGVHLAGEQTLILVSGAWLSLLPLCVKGNTEELTAAAAAMEADGLQVIAVAYRLTDIAPAVYTDEELEHDLTCVGLLGLQMPLRQKVADAADIVPTLHTILFSNEPGSSAAAAAIQTGLTDAPCIATAETVECLTDDEWHTAVEKYNVYCGLAPLQKQRVVAVLQEQGHIVAVTGCHSDEAELLTEADVGFVRGTAATDVAKSAADILLTDDNYACAITAFEEGRRLAKHHLYAIAYLVLCSIVIAGIGVGCLFGWLSLPYPAVLLTGLHLLLMAILPILALTAEDIVKKK